jgi:hypothetical protein
MDFLPTTGKLQVDCDSTRSIYVDNTAYNIALGKSALAAATTAARSVAIGYKTLSAATTADYNIAIGYEALKSLTVLPGQENVAIGLGALSSLVGGKYNVALGNDSGPLATGDYNSFIGRTAAPALVDGTGNAFLGEASGTSITSGDYNTCLGYLTGRGSAGALSSAVCIGRNTRTSTDYYVQIGKSGDASHSAKGYFYSQQWMDEAWRDTVVGLAKIDGTGNFVKGTDAVSAGTDDHIVRWNGTTGLQDSAITISDAGAITGASSITLTNAINEFSTDGTLAGNSDTALPTEKAVKTYVDGAWSTHNVTWTGAINNTASTLSYRVANGCAFLDIPTFTGTGASSAGTIHNTGTELPTAIRPAAEHSETMYCIDNGTHMSAYVIIRTTGVITICRMQVSGSNVSYANFSSNAGNNGLIHGHTMKYKLA